MKTHCNNVRPAKFKLLISLCHKILNAMLNFPTTLEFASWYKISATSFVTYLIYNIFVVHSTSNTQFVHFVGFGFGYQSILLI